MNTSQPTRHPARWAAVGLTFAFLAVGCDPSATAADGGMLPDADTGTDGGMSPDADTGTDGGASADASADGAMQPDGSGEDPPSIAPVVVAAGGEHTCLIDDAGALSCWGENNAGQLGGPEGAIPPVQVALEGVRRVEAYGDTTCAVDDAGRGWCFGWVVPGEPMAGAGRGAPVAVPGDGIAALAPGQSHGCALGVDQTVRCWGTNERGQLGTGEMRDVREGSAQPLAVAGLPPATAIATGDEHTCALLEDARVWCWGFNDAGQLGRQVDEPYFDPSPAAADVAGVVQIDAGGRGTCAVLDTGELRCWGIVGDRFFGLEPVRVTDMPGFSSVSIGGGHACAVRAGEVWCWGQNDDRQLGRSGEGGEIPQRVEWLEPAVSVTAGGRHTCAELQDGSVTCWGSSEHSQTIIPGDPRTMVDVDLQWDEDGVALVLDGPAVNWQLGIAETDAGEQGWTGESCGGETMFDADVCHSIGPDGGRVASVYPDVDRVADGFTLFNASFAPALTYILHAEEPIRYAFECIVWGHDPGYYGEFGCVRR